MNHKVTLVFNSLYAEVSVTVLTRIHVLLNSIGHVLKSLCCHFGSKVPVERRRHASLLHVSQNVLPTGEHTFPFLGEQMLNEVSRVVGIGIFISTQNMILTMH